MRVLFARIGYMNYYRGLQPGDDKLIGGGKYNEEHDGHEKFNFYPEHEKMYGYFQPNMKGSCPINLKRIDPEFAYEDEIENVLVIFFSRRPDIGKPVIVGWYKNAKVYRECQSAPKNSSRDNCGYYITCRQQDAVLLPIKKRTYVLGHGIKGEKKGNPGQANTFYYLDDYGEVKNEGRFTQWIKPAIQYVRRYSAPSLVTEADIDDEKIKNAVGQGFISNVTLRLAVEKYAMDRCKAYLKRNRYTVKDVSANSPYDILATKDGKEYLVEVKGTTSAGKKVFLTRNEVALHKQQDHSMILFVLHSIEVDGDNVVARSGVVKVFDPWILDESNLKPTHYEYVTGI